MMQQTEKYKFNLIETSDTFSPDALNANARTAEAELAALADDTAEKLAAIRADLGFGTPGKVARIAWGTAQGANYKLTLTFDFRPMLLFVYLPGSIGATATVIRGSQALDFTGYSIGRAGTVVWGEKDVALSGTEFSTAKVSYVAIGEPLK